MSTLTLARTRACTFTLALALASALAAALDLAPVTPALAGDATSDAPGDATEVERLTTENEALRRRVRELEAREGDAQGAAPEAGAAKEPGYVVVKPAPAADAARLTTITEAGTRTVSTGASPLDVTRGSRAQQWVVFRYQRAGEQPVRDITMDVHTQFSGSIYRRVKTLALTVDGERIDCPVAGYDARAVTGGGSRRRVTKNHEELTVTIPVATLRRMAAAQAVTGRLGPIGFTLTRDQLASLRALDGTVGN